MRFKRMPTESVERTPLALSEPEAWAGSPETATALKHWHAGEIMEATRLLVQSCNTRPHDVLGPRLLLHVAVAEAFAAKDILTCIDNIRRLAPLSPEERALYGAALFSCKRYGEALPYLEEADRDYPWALEVTQFKAENISVMARYCRWVVAVGREPPKARGPLPQRNSAGAPRKKTPERPVRKRPKEDGKSGRAREVKPPPPEAPPPPRPVEIPKLTASASIGSPSFLLEPFLSGAVSTFRAYALAQEACGLSQAERFDHLLCLNTLTGVTHYAYQVETVRKVMRSFRGRVLLADEVGLGKTIEAGMILKEYLLRGMVRKALILTPPALTSQWWEELSTKFGLDVHTTDDPASRQDPEAFWHGHDLIVASLALARNKTHRPILAGMTFDLIIVDEAHHVKNDKSAGWDLVNALKSRFLLLLSATPVETHLTDLYSLITLLKPGQLGTKASFRKEFILRGDPTQPRNQERLRDLIGEVMIRNTRALADVRLPPRHASTVLVEGEPAEQELYAKLTDLVREGFRRNLPRMALGLLLQEAGSSPMAVRNTLLKLAGHEDIEEDLRHTMGRLANLCRYVPTTSKISRLLDLLRVSKEKVLVFSRFTVTLEEISRRLAEEGVRFSVFQGNMSGQEKDRAVSAFEDGVPVMLCSEIGGEGRNLQFCATMVNYDLPWNPMKIEQRIGRIHRIGQTRPVHIYNLCATNTAEHRILEMLDRRINMFELVVGEVDLVLGQTKTEAEFEERILDIYGRSQDDGDVAEAFERLGEELLAARRQYDKIKRLDTALFGNDYEI